MILSNIEQFMKEFSELKTVSLMDMQSDYDQIALKKKSHNLTEFMTVLRLLQNCTLIQNEINSVAQFCRAMIQILEDLIFTVCCMFLDNIAVKEPWTDYDDKEILTEVHHYVLKLIQNLNKILVNVECAEECVSDEKSQFVMKKLRIMKFICESEECFSETVKVLKIVKWSSCWSIKDAQTFIELCVYYWLWIKKFVMIMISIYDLFKKNHTFDWETEEQKVMDCLKIVLSTQSIIQSLIYDDDTDKIILAVNSSLKSWNFCLMQVAKNQQHQHVCRYDSETWSSAESLYNAEKWECWELLKALKKVRTYLYEVLFVIELNAQTLVTQLNRSAADVLSVLINCWLTWIQLFDFDIQHLLEKKHQASDALFRRLKMVDETEFSENDMKKFLDTQLFHSSVWFYLVSVSHSAEDKFKLVWQSVLNSHSKYSEEQKSMIKYLVTL